jgi:hypothetical protein
MKLLGMSQYGSKYGSGGLATRSIKITVKDL